MKMAMAGVSRFHSNELCSSAGAVEHRQVKARIEVIVKRFLKCLVDSDPSVYPLSMVNRTSNNTLLREGLCEGDGIFLSLRNRDKLFTNLNSVNSYIRGQLPNCIICYQLLMLGKKVTQREMFYILLSDSPHYFQCQKQVNQSIQDAVALIKCNRYSLGIVASSRGSLVGRLIIQEPNRQVIDCTKIGMSGYQITGDLHLLQTLILTSDARYILLVEKDAIFQRLSEDRYFQLLPTIIITAKGYPDMGTRVMLHKLATTFPGLPILGLVDWNPAGLGILCTYKYGSVNMGLEALEYVCDVKWLGIRAKDVEVIPSEAIVKLSKRDRELGAGLVSSKMLQNNGRYKEEVERMLEFGMKAEIEALYCHGYDFLTKFISQKIVQLDYI